jgi:hypothetical protein
MSRYRIVIETRANGTEKVTIERHRKGGFFGNKDIWEGVRFQQMQTEDGQMGPRFVVMLDPYYFPPEDFISVESAKLAIDQVLVENKRRAGFKIVGEPRYEEYP